jgi:hypothetical protein
MRYLLAPLLFSVALFGCAAQQQQQPNGPPGMTASNGDGSGSDMVCHDETPTGSTISHQVCRPKDDMSNKDQPGVLNDMQHGSPSASPTVGNGGR